MPIDDETTCHRKRTANEATIIRTGRMTVIRERFIDEICARNRSVSSPSGCHNQTDPEIKGLVIRRDLPLHRSLIMWRGGAASQRAQIIRHVAELPDHLGIAEIACSRVTGAAERDRAKYDPPCEIAPRRASPPQ
jgi:hypothetical protein